MAQPTTVYPDCTPFMQPFLTPDLRAMVPRLVVHHGLPTDPQEFKARLAGHQALVFGELPLPLDVLQASVDLKLIVFLGTGVGFYVDMDEAKRRGIAVHAIPGYGDRTVAEHSFALMMAASRKIAAMDRRIRAGVWEAEALGEQGGQTLGIVGLGGIGRALARMARGFGMEVIAWNRSPVGDFPDGRLVDLDALMAEADVVSLHVGLNDQTRGMIDRRRLELMKPTAIVVNTARGAVTDETALVDLLQSGRIAGAALDVFEQEPLPPEHPLARLPSVTLTAHAGWMSPESSRRLLSGAFQILARELPKL